VTDPGARPGRPQQQPYQAFDLPLLYNKTMHLVTIRAAMAATTPGTFDRILGPAQSSRAAAASDLSAPPGATALTDMPTRHREVA
jgi:hypothetical protein